ncbi:metallophosphoesterase [Jiella pelagia]|uniref:Metallophosphoesterase n=1 Tax=Jiella pelagia TaxID=2986949 RepID=A0ABY7BYJ7_9HYPH|nr:metallophosphoesterase [Jiella pelagia]WAP68477.1 metallophosphoesterase [Jiella pelagia]
MPEIHFTADHHFFHDGIIRMCGRPFSSTDEMNETMIERRNAVVHGNDVVYHLGDFAMKGTAEGCAAVFKRIKGRKHLIVGNHDKARVTSLPWASAPQARMLVRVPGEKVPLVLDHYAMRTWPSAHHGAVHLYGHSHGNLPGMDRRGDGTEFRWTREELVKAA